MNERVELTGAGLAVRDIAGRCTAAVSFVDGVGDGALVILVGNVAAEIPLDADALRHLREVATSTECNSRLAADAEGVLRCVPRPAPTAPHLPG